MDFRLKIMKKYFVILSLFFLACSASKQSHINNNYDKAWINAFKDKYFVSCLKESYKNDSIFKMIDEVDLYNPYDGFYTIDEYVVKAEKLGQNISKDIPSTNYKDYGKSNYYMATCLHYYASKELDSIAKSEYKKFIKAREK